MTNARALTMSLRPATGQVGRRSRPRRPAGAARRKARTADLQL